MSASAPAARSKRQSAWGGRALGALVALAALLLVSCGPVVPGQWQMLETPGSESILALAQDITSARLIYAGGTGGHVYRAIADRTVVPVEGEGIPQSAVVDALVVDPQAAGTVYAATSQGLYVTTDNGDHWRARGSGFPSGDTMDALALAPQTRTLYAGTTAHGVYVSQDQGQTWRPAGGGLPASANINALFWEQATQMVFASVDGVGVFASTDGGASWTARMSGLPPQTFALLELASHGLSASGSTLYAGTNKGVFASTNGGQQWSATSAGLPSGRVLSLGADSALPGSLYAGTDNTVYHSADGGRTWRLLAPGLSHQVAALLVAHDTHGQAIVLAGAGQLARYPPLIQSGGIGAAILNLLLLGLVVAAGVYLFYRARRQMREMERSSGFAVRSRVPGAAGSELVQPGESAEPAPRESSNGRRPRAKVTRPTAPLRPPRETTSLGHDTDGAGNGHDQATQPDDEPHE